MAKKCSGAHVNYYFPASHWGYVINCSAVVSSAQHFISGSLVTLKRKWMWYAMIVTTTHTPLPGHKNTKVRLALNSSHLSTARLESVSGAGRRRERHSPTHTEGFSGKRGEDLGIQAYWQWEVVLTFLVELLSRVCHFWPYVLFTLKVWWDKLI